MVTVARARDTSGPGADLGQRCSESPTRPWALPTASVRWGLATKSKESLFGTSHRDRIDKLDKRIGNEDEFTSTEVAGPDCRARHRRPACGAGEGERFDGPMAGCRPDPALRSNELSQCWHASLRTA